MDHPALAAAMVLALIDWESADLAAFNCALTGFGVVDKVNRAYGPALRTKLIREDGHPIAKHEVLAALSAVINQRTVAGELQERNANA